MYLDGEHGRRKKWQWETRTSVLNLLSLIFTLYIQVDMWILQLDISI